MVIAMSYLGVCCSACASIELVDLLSFSPMACLCLWSVESRNSLLACEGKYECSVVAR